MDDRDWSDPVRRDREAYPPLAVRWSRDQTAMAIRRIWRLQVSTGKPLDHFTYAHFLSTCSDEDCVDSGPRDRRLYLDLMLTVSTRHLQKVRRVGHSPTREKERDMTRLNRGVDSPINCRHYLLIYLTRGAPHGHPRVLALSRDPSPRGRAVRILRSTWAARGLPRGLRAVSPPRGGPRATCRAAGFPARHVITCGKPTLFF